VLYFLLIIAALLLPFSFRLKASTEKDYIALQAEYLFFGKIGIAVYKSKLTVKKAIRSLFSGKKSKVNKARIFTSVKNHISLDKLYIKSEIGTGSAASTAILSGQAFSFIAPFACLAARAEKCYVSINPNFNEAIFDFSGEIIISTNIANAIILVLEALKCRKVRK